MIDVSNLTATQRTQLLDQVYDKGVYFESNFGNCAQSAIAAVMEVLELPLDDVFKAAHGLAGGTGGSEQGTCGAICGAALVAGYFAGRPKAEFATNKNPGAKPATKVVLDRVTAEFGSPICGQIKANNAAASSGEGDLTHNCGHVTGVAARQIAELILAGAV